jgi:hypothetical protein
LHSWAQDTQEPAQPQTQNAASATTTSTLHGVVLNAATGDPLPRALVRLVGEEGAGTLTDGEGRYEIPGVASGPQQVETVKPGFLDETAEAAARGQWNEVREFAHTVIVAAEMPDVVFRMAPANSIRGQVQLSTGETAQGIEISLLKETIEDGRTAWQMAAGTKTNADGVYRFGGLADGAYVVYSAPAMESEAITNLVEPGSARAVQRRGYASLFYPEAHDLAGAGKIQLQSGTQAEANLSLPIEPFYTVTATTLPPGGRAAETEPPGPFAMMFSAEVADGQGHRLSYVAQYDPGTHSVQTFLPDGNYMFVVNGERPMIAGRTTTKDLRLTVADEGRVAGEVEFSVAGHAVNNLRIPVATVRRSSVQVNLTRTRVTETSSAQEGGDGISITISQTGGWIGDGMTSGYAAGTLAAPLNTDFTQPGTYWVHTNLSDRHICESSFTAGGANLAREPLTLGIAGPAAPLTLNLRDDCARLTLTLPATAAGTGMGEEPFYTVYLVPDFDTTADLVPQTLRPSTGGTITLEGLTPGSYHVYVFDKPVALAYHDRAMLEALSHPGQSVELAAASSSSLMLEVPNHE